MQSGSRGWGQWGLAPPIFWKNRGNNDLIAVYDVSESKRGCAIHLESVCQNAFSLPVSRSAQDIIFSNTSVRC